VEVEVNYNLRVIQESDNQHLARIIRSSLREYGVDKPGTVFTDPTTDNLFGLFDRSDAVYFVAELEGTILGGGGIYPTTGLPNQCAELVKLYVDQRHRNKGIGKQLMKSCEVVALELGYTSLYLETLPELEHACSLYERMGYVKQSQPLGNSGHYACTLWMLKNLS
jgi:putative acetyltransferase